MIINRLWDSRICCHYQHYTFNAVFIAPW